MTLPPLGSTALAASSGDAAEKLGTVSLSPNGRAILEAILRRAMRPERNLRIVIGCGALLGGLAYGSLLHAELAHGAWGVWAALALGFVVLSGATALLFFVLGVAAGKWLGWPIGTEAMCLRSELPLLALIRVGGEGTGAMTINDALRVLAGDGPVRASAVALLLELDARSAGDHSSR